MGRTSSRSATQARPCRTFQSASSSRSTAGEGREHTLDVGVRLALVAGFAELHGGRAWVQDAEGGGASFRVRLPVRAATATSADPIA
jgi:signal transduction histidine kinase